MNGFDGSELVIGLVGAVGTDLSKVITILTNRLASFQYKSVEIRISQDIIPQIIDTQDVDLTNEYTRINSYMTAGNRARELSKDNSILALGASAKINEGRPEDGEEPPYRKRHAYIINSLKRPEEVTRLREIYTEGFYLIGVYSDERRRYKYLNEDFNIPVDDAMGLIKRDQNEDLQFGQRTRDTFHLSDFFVPIDGNEDKLKKDLWRITDIIFGHPYKTPTFDEYAMFLAYSASLRSADLSRQVGAVIAKNKSIIAMGANDCPRYGGGLYWPDYDKDSSEVVDEPLGRDYTRGVDSNKIEKEKIIEDIINNLGDLITDSKVAKSVLKKSMIQDITEYGRVVHAEMEALLSCSRNNISAKDATLYGTTFPCHNCAKHIIAAGINRVVYVEPYPKSRAADFHDDAISLGFSKIQDKVRFEPFVGIGPRRFFDLFSTRLGSGYPLIRKDLEGKTRDWNQESAELRIQMIPISYIEKETLAAGIFNKCRKEFKSEKVTS